MSDREQLYRSDEERRQLDEPPEFDLEFVLDEQDRPTEVTVFDPDGHFATSWLTAEKAIVLDLEETQ